MNGLRKLLGGIAADVLRAVVRDPGEQVPRPGRRLVTILFARIRGFPPVSEPLQPEQMAELLCEYFTEATEIVDRHGGIVNKYIGDSIMVLYNVPLEDPEHALNAVRTGLELQERTLAVSARWEAKLGAPIRTAAGINTGEVVVGFLGSQQRPEYTAVGDPVTVASHLLEAAEPDTILIGDATSSLVQGVVRVESVEPLRVEGRSRPIVAHRLVGIGIAHV